MSDSLERTTRRAFLSKSGAALGGGMLAFHLPSLLSIADEAYAAHARGDAFKTLTEDEAVEIEAIANQIMPTDETPGAREAGVVYFIDRALGDERANRLDMTREGLADLTKRAQDAHGKVFSKLSAVDQLELLRQIEDTEFFESTRFLTLAGMFAHPSYGGNRNRIGWKLIGFDDRHFWQPPFGYYDAHYEDPYRTNE